MPTYRLNLEYEGTRYHGWQEQKNARSVVGELRRAVTEAGGGVVREIGGSGRTDAGVHALAQVAHLRLARPVDPGPFRLAVNDALPPDIHVLSLTPVPDAFHARHSAVARSYVYQICRRRTAFAKRWVWWVKRPLDAGRMAETAALLPGRHDFRLFCERPGEQPSTVVVVDRVEVVEAGALILVRLVASHFLWKMVRRVVGTLVQVGAGDLDRAGFVTLMNGQPPRGGKGLPAEWTAPPSGLFLERVLYPGDGPLGPVSPVTPVLSEEW
ncbi:MAG: tRNA pseudouridine(38-40) synthase TruA [Acidobacteriota bacterium]